MFTNTFNLFKIVVFATGLVRLTGCFKVENAKPLSLHEVVGFVVMEVSIYLLMECDALNVVNALNLGSSLASNDLIFSYIKSVLNFAHCGYCHYVFRNENKLVQLLASRALCYPNSMY